MASEPEPARPVGEPDVLAALRRIAEAAEAATRATEAMAQTLRGLHRETERRVRSQVR